MYRLEVKRLALPPRPFRWEIYRGKRSTPVRSSGSMYASREQAIAAGTFALESLTDRLVKEGGRVRRNARTRRKRREKAERKIEP
jgi:hypothetical protein